MAVSSNWIALLGDQTQYDQVILEKKHLHMNGNEWETQESTCSFTALDR